jgi:hypothetical protein
MAVVANMSGTDEFIREPFQGYLCGRDDVDNMDVIRTAEEIRLRLNWEKYHVKI